VKWQGGRDLTVAAALHEGEAPHGFALDGSPVTLSETAAPEQPVLVLTSKETDFEQTLDAGEYQNIEDAGGAIGTMVRRTASVVTPASGSRIASMISPIDCPQEPMIRASEPRVGSQLNERGARKGKVITDPLGGGPRAVCEEDPGTGGGWTPPPTLPPGIWLTNSNISNYEEPWYRGTAEIQLMLSGPAMNGFEGARLSCSGQYARTQNQNDRNYKYFDQSGNGWSRNPYLIEGLLFGKADLDQFGTLYQNSVSTAIELWEDDSGGENCNFNGDAQSNGLENFIADLRGAYGVVSQVITILTPALGMNPVTLGITLAMSIRQLMGSGDDIILGRAINIRLADGSFSQQSFRLIRQSYFFGRYFGMQDNGSITLTIIQPPIP
jgi:hypothetical protein